MPAPSTPAVATARPSLGAFAETLIDAEAGFSLALPPGWVVLRAGDPRWAEVYGRHGTSTEQHVEDGTIDDFAVPVPQVRDDISLNLAVYVEPTAGRDLSGVGDTYARTLRGTDRVTNVARQDVALGSGPAVLLTADRAGASGAAVGEERLLAWVVVHDGRALHFVFVCSRADRDTYGPLFAAVMETLAYP